jgi:hypothetical protein
MQTYIKVKGFENNPGFEKHRQKAIEKLELNSIDKPIQDLIGGFQRLSYCFTLQSCYGHFLYEGMNDPYNTESIQTSEIIKEVDYKIAYIAICIQDSLSGRALFEELRKIPEIDNGYIQFGCARWFWKQQVNSFVLQVEPERYRFEDRITLGYKEALHIEKVRNLFFQKLEEVIRGMVENLKK